MRGAFAAALILLIVLARVLLLTLTILTLFPPAKLGPERDSSSHSRLAPPGARKRAGFEPPPPSAAGPTVVVRVRGSLEGEVVVLSRAGRPAVVER